MIESRFERESSTVFLEIRETPKLWDSVRWRGCPNAEFVTLIKGHSFKPETIAAIEGALAGEKIGLLIIDADGRVQRDLNCYARHLAGNCWIVIDDYFGPPSNKKVVSTKAEVDALVGAGSLMTLGYYGWGTWVGRRSAQASS